MTENQRARGSSPLARGTPRIVQLHILGPRLIPARAGNTRCRCKIRSGVPAHPRSRGEHRACSLRFVQQSGSSPLARGTRCLCAVGWVGLRLIPARAGNTTFEDDSEGYVAAHPRSRGEHQNSINPRHMSGGSSPLARGTHLLTWGFTPYTGKIGLLWSQSLHPEYTISSHY